MRIVHTRYFLPKVEIKDYNVMIDQQSFFDQSIKNDQKINNSIQKIQLVKEIVLPLVVC